MNPMKNLTGQRFGSLKVIEYSPRKTKWGGTYWVCQCECERLLICRADNLRSGKTTQCSICRNHSGRRSVFVEEGVVNGVV